MAMVNHDLDGLRETASKIIFDGGDFLVAVGPSRMGLGIRADLPLPPRGWKCVPVLVENLTDDFPARMEALLLPHAQDKAARLASARAELENWITHRVGRKARG